MALRDALARDRDFADRLAGTTLWATVQGRVVLIQGCAADASLAPALEAYARRLPDVLQAVAALRTDPAAPPPYRLRSSR